MRKSILKNIEWSIVICVMLLLILGSFALYSASSSSDYEAFKKQILWIFISLPFAIIATMIDYHIFARYSMIFYIGAIILLLVVLLTGRINGATSWFTIGNFSIQPGEFAKIAVVLFLAYNLDKITKKSTKAINNPINLIIIISIAILPIILIILEPDYGTAMAYIISLVLMLFVSGIDKKYILISIIIIAIALPLLYFFILPEHAKARIDVYLNPNLDPRGDGYNIIQSKIAIGAGGLFGLGWLQGTQTHLGFLYPKTTDFIFSVIGEELGFITCVTIVIIYVIFLNKSINIAKTSPDNCGSYIAIGIVGIFLFHIIENIGMTIGLLPITGVPLPFVSYGGSALITDMIGLGLLLNVAKKRRGSIFTI